MGKRRAGEDPDMLGEYDFSGGVRGKYVEQYRAGRNIVQLDPDVAELFPDASSVNDALRALADLARKQAGKRRKKARK
jgi:hypothetical protein